MGSILSLGRVSGWKTEEDEAQRSISLNLTRRSSTLFERLLERLCCTLKGIWRKTCSVPISLIRCLKGIWRKTCSVLISLYRCFKGVINRIKPRKTSCPLLPLENPTPKQSDLHPLNQGLLISNSDGDSGCPNIDVFAKQNQEYSSETKNTKDSVTISTPGFGGIHSLASYSASSITHTDFAVFTRENAEHEKTGKGDQMCEESSDQYLEQNHEYYPKVKSILDSVTISIPNFGYHAFDYNASSSTDTDSAAIIQENGPQKNESYAEHEGPGIYISTEKKFHESSEEKEIEVEKVIESTVVVEKARWIKHYSSIHRILLVGEGDFSFSYSLAAAFGCASKMVATSLDSEAFLKKNYAKAPWNIRELKKMGCIVMHGIDATTIATQQLLQHKTFDRVIYNFPYAGFFKGLSRDSSIWLHRRLVSLFLKNAKEMIDVHGEIHISHKTNGYHREWNLVSMARSHGLRLIEEVEFILSDYPGYNTKRGFGGDENFDCYPSNTFKFGLKLVGHGKW
ncbi:uncharacterized protein [Primulina eburnea]|uniref:uncharacterized protein n=1 Tax=Primulina eburnea TaxID=1245227 RepID=UPI003C6C57CE